MHEWFSSELNKLGRTLYILRIHFMLYVLWRSLTVQVDARDHTLQCSVITLNHVNQSLICRILDISPWHWKARWLQSQCLAVCMYMYTTTFTKIISNQTPYTHRQINLYINTPPVVLITKKTPLMYTVQHVYRPSNSPTNARQRATKWFVLVRRIRGQKRVGNRHLARYRGVRAKLSALSRVSCFPSVPLGGFPAVRVEYVVCLRWGTCDSSCWEKLR